MMRAINFDMDGTLADFYSVEGWLDCLMNSEVTPYAEAKPLLNFSALARQIHRVQALGYEVNIISWLCKSGSDEYNQRVIETKKAWLKNHLPSVTFNNITIVEYGTPKSQFGEGILIDDEIGNRKEWMKSNDANLAFDVDNILGIMKSLR